MGKANNLLRSTGKQQTHRKTASSSARSSAVLQRAVPPSYPVAASELLGFPYELGNPPGMQRTWTSSAGLCAQRTGAGPCAVKVVGCCCYLAAAASAGPLSFLSSSLTLQSDFGLFLLCTGEAVNLIFHIIRTYDNRGGRRCDVPSQAPELRWQMIDDRLTPVLDSLYLTLNGQYSKIVNANLQGSVTWVVQRSVDAAWVEKTSGHADLI
ncbi:hypothetical protein V8E53_000194 [Lactarius tabidus]